MVLYIFELLVFFDKNGCYMFGFVILWKFIDVNMWEIKFCFNVKWSDGMLFIGEDVKVFIECLVCLINSFGLFISYIKLIIDVQIVDLFMVWLKLLMFNYVSILNDLNSLFIILKKVVNVVQVDFDVGCVMIGIGLFLFDYFMCGQEIVLKKNLYYWGCVLQWDKVIFKIIIDNVVCMVVLFLGDVDVVEVVLVVDVLCIKQDLRFYFE